MNGWLIKLRKVYQVFCTNRFIMQRYRKFEFFEFEIDEERTSSVYPSFIISRIITLETIFILIIGF